MKPNDKLDALQIIAVTVAETDLIKLEPNNAGGAICAEGESDLDFRTYKVLPEIVADHFAVYAEVVYGKADQQAPADRGARAPDE